MSARGRRGEKSERERGKTAQRFVKSKSERASLSLSLPQFAYLHVKVYRLSCRSRGYGEEREAPDA